MVGGNFGFFARNWQQGPWRRFLSSKRRQLKLMRFDVKEMMWVETKYWCSIVRTLPIRIKYRKLSLLDIPK